MHAGRQSSNVDLETAFVLKAGAATPKVCQAPGGWVPEDDWPHAGRRRPLHEQHGWNPPLRNRPRRVCQPPHRTRYDLPYPRQNLQGKRDFAAVAAGRQEHAVPILAQFKAWLDEENREKRILPKSPIRAAFTYTLNQWAALGRYTEQGYLSFDNNVAERLVKIPAIGRKNYLFVGSENGGRGAAVMYSLVSSAKANGVEPLRLASRPVHAATRSPRRRSLRPSNPGRSGDQPRTRPSASQINGSRPTQTTPGPSTKSAETKGKNRKPKCS